jgi:hypothetical protein
MNKNNIYLVAQYYMKPKAHVRTHVKGWMKDPNNIRYDEKVEISRGLRSKDVNAKIILDLTNKQVHKNGFATDRPFDEIFKYFFANYNEYIIKVMTQLDPVYLDQIVTELEKEIAEAEQAQKTQVEAGAPENQIPLGTINSEKVQA